VFGLIGRCSAAEARERLVYRIVHHFMVSLRRIRNEKLYRVRAWNWEEFFSQIGVRRRNVERSIRALEEFRPSFFHLAPLTHLKREEIPGDRVQCDGGRNPYRGQVIPFLPENTGKVTAAVAQLLRRDGRPGAKPAATPFELALNRCQVTSQSLDKLPVLEPAQEMPLAAALVDMREKANTLGFRCYRGKYVRPQIHA
jgi:hypothetical protein